MAPLGMTNPKEEPLNSDVVTRTPTCHVDVSSAIVYCLRSMAGRIAEDELEVLRLQEDGAGHGEEQERHRAAPRREAPVPEQLYVEHRVASMELHVTDVAAMTSPTAIP